MKDSRKIRFRSAPHLVVFWNNGMEWLPPLGISVKGTLPAPLKHFQTSSDGGGVTVATEIGLGEKSR